MKTSRKATLIVIALVLLAGLVWIVWRQGAPAVPGAPAAPGVSDAPRSPSFAVYVEKPRINRFLFGILPNSVEDKLFGNVELRFDHTSRGAGFGSVGPDRLELHSDGWNLFIETDGGGKIAPGTRLVFPILLAERQRTLRCRPSGGSNGYLNAVARAEGSNLLDGRFLVELATCENAETGKVINWPSSPLTVTGTFEGLPQIRR